MRLARYHLALNCDATDWCKELEAIQSWSLRPTGPTHFHKFFNRIVEILFEIESGNSKRRLNFDFRISSLEPHTPATAYLPSASSEVGAVGRETSSQNAESSRAGIRFLSS